MIYYSLEIFLGLHLRNRKIKNTLFLHTWIAVWQQPRIFDGRFNVVGCSPLLRPKSTSFVERIADRRRNRKPEESRAICTTPETLPHCGQFCSFALPDNRSRDKTTGCDPFFVTRPAWEPSAGVRSEQKLVGQPWSSMGSKGAVKHKSLPSSRPSPPTLTCHRKRGL